MSISGRQPTAAGRAAVVAATVTLALVLAACGGGDNGGGGGGGGDTQYIIQVAIANETTEDATIELTDAEPQTLATCKGNVYTFNLPVTDWILSVNGQPVVDSLDLDPNYLDKNLVANLWLNEDGTVDVERVQPGSNIQKPAQPSICT